MLRFAECATDAALWPIIVWALGVLAISVGRFVMLFFSRCRRCHRRFYRHWRWC